MERMAFVGVGVLMLASCAFYSVPYQVPYNSLTVTENDEFAVGVTGSMVTMVDSAKERYRTSAIANGNWIFYNKDENVVSVRLFMFTHTSYGKIKDYVSSGSYLMVEYYRRPEVSTHTPIKLVYGVYLGFYYEFGNYLNKVLPGSDFLYPATSPTAMGALGGFWFGGRFYINPQASYYIKLHLGAPGGVVFAYRYKNFDFHLGTHVVGTFLSLYPVSSLGVTYRF